MSRRPAPDVELIPFPEVMDPLPSPLSPPSGGGTVIKVNIHPIVLFFIVVLLYISLSLWATAGERLIFSGLLGDRPLAWWQVALIALGVSLLVIAVTWFSGISLEQLEQEI